MITQLTEPVIKQQSKESHLTSLLNSEYKKLDVAELRDQGIHVTPMKENPLAWRVVMFNFPEDTPIAIGLEEYRRQFGIVCDN